MKKVAKSIDTSNGNFQLLGMAGRGFLNKLRPSYPPPFYTMPVKRSMSGQGGGSLYMSRIGQYGGAPVRYGKIWSG
jgi:hypothetical protein